MRLWAALGLSLSSLARACAAVCAFACVCACVGHGLRILRARSPARYDGLLYLTVAVGNESAGTGSECRADVA